MDAEMRMEDLILKGIFVRFISHELRYNYILYVEGLLNQLLIISCIEYWADRL